MKMLTTQEDRRVIREVRADLFRAPIIIYHDKASLASMSASKIRALLGTGIIGAQAIKALPATAEALPPPTAAREAGAVSGTGDYVTGMAENHVLRAVCSTNASMYFASTTQISGPHILADVDFQYNDNTNGGIDGIVYCDVKISTAPLTTQTSFDNAQSIFNSVRASAMVVKSTRPIGFFKLNGNPSKKLHLDVLIDWNSVVYTFGVYSPTNSGDDVSCILNIRPASTAQRAAVTIKLPTPLAHLTRPPSAFAVRDTLTLGGAPVINVMGAKPTVKPAPVAPLIGVPFAPVETPKTDYEAFLYDRSFILDVSDITTFSTAWNPIVIVPAREANTTYSRLFTGGKLTPYASQYQRGLPYTPVKYKK